ncbi:chitinase [Niveomyces insectorum RCEF 264]|uniref:chitinase n=1 Tax=Niveomyces insectorum RCEF 264 TaxID=1081102 RepID=A0A167T7J8_9HYPO|nr:chitinase [Niveomyces insectorum RCEF 264]
MLLGFSLYDNVDDPSTTHRIFSCTTFVGDWINVPGRISGGNLSTHSSSLVTGAATPAQYQLGWNADGHLSASDIRALSRQLRSYLAHPLYLANKTVYMFGRSNSGTIGLYIGKNLQSAGTSEPALKAFESQLRQLNATNTVALQLCDNDRDRTFGVMAASNASFSAIQKALQTWSNASCLTFAGGSVNITSEAVYVTSLVPPFGDTNGTSLFSRSRRSGTSHAVATNMVLAARDYCRTISAVKDDTCSKLASKCGITPYDFTQYNPGPDVCSTLMPGTHVCCSAGEKPSFAPKPGSDGSCATHIVDMGETCSSLAAAYDLTVQQIENFNTHTWAFNGCGNILFNSSICLSPGRPPMPLPVANAQCGPQMPGTPPPPDGTDLNTLNPCPINACCDVWGSCGTTSEYCTNSSTSSAPGTAAPGTAGCISNCGTEIVIGSPPAEFITVGYFEGYQFGRDCLYQEARQLDTSKFTHLHFAFGIIGADYSINTGDKMSSFEFDAFRRLRGVKRIISFGGWGFSTSPDTYDIFRQGVKPGNREVLAKNVVQFVHDNSLDGVDFDWEYPGAYDIPGIPPPVDGKDEGPNYLEFLKLVRQLLPDKSISIAAPSSYWYLRNFPIAEMSQVVDYIVYMTGMRATGGPSLAVTRITKAGVPSNKVVVGVTSYGRSFNMANADCSTIMCQFTGTATQSDAKKGACTNVGGYIADAEIKQIMADKSRVQQSYVDADSNILVYDDNQWVSYMDENVRARRSSIYKGLHFGGTTNWAIDLEDFIEPPQSVKTWDDFILGIVSGQSDPYVFGTRNGTWTTLRCDDEAIQGVKCYTPSQRWDMLDGKDAWADIINAWTQYYNISNDADFIESVSDILHGPELVGCGDMKASDNCDQTLTCAAFVGDGTGAVAYDIYNSLVIIHETFKNFWNSLIDASAVNVMASLDLLEDTFAPVPPTHHEVWLDILMALLPLGLISSAAPFFNGVIYGWANMTEYALKNLMNGDAESVKRLTALISDGKLIEGAAGPPPAPCPGLLMHPSGSANDLTASAQMAATAKTIFAFAIPALWNISGNRENNGGPLPDLSDKDTVDSLMSSDITTPGFIRIPVCSADMAYKAWDSLGRPSLPNYPCVMPPGKDDCGDSTFEDRTSDASPLVSDCMHIVTNIEGTDGEWEIDNSFAQQHQEVQYGTCAFGVQGDGRGSIRFHLGSQDIVDIITESVKRFGSSGKANFLLASFPSQLRAVAEGICEPQTPGESGKRVPKANKACVPCRVRKVKCDAAAVGLPCSSCIPVASNGAQADSLNISRESNRHPSTSNTPYHTRTEASNTPRACLWRKLPPLDDIDHEYLVKKGVFDLPAPRHLVEFIRRYQSGDCSLFLLRVILTPAVLHAPADVLSACGFESRSAAQESFFSKAKLLHDFSAEDDPILMLQGSVILTMVILDHPSDWDFGYWFHNAIRLATKLDLRNIRTVLVSFIERATTRSAPNAAATRRVARVSRGQDARRCKYWNRLVLFEHTDHELQVRVHLVPPHSTPLAAVPPRRLERVGETAPSVRYPRIGHDCHEGAGEWHPS